MKKTKILTFLILALSIFSFTENTFSSTTPWVYCDPQDAFCLDKKIISDPNKPTLKVDITLDKLIENWVVYLLWFLYLVSVSYWLYWAFNILTAGSDDDKVEKWKKIIFRAVLWIIVIFSASIIAQFLLWNWTDNSLLEQTRKT